MIKSRIPSALLLSVAGLTAACSDDDSPGAANVEKSAYTGGASATSGGAPNTAATGSGGGSATGSQTATGGTGGTPPDTSQSGGASTGGEAGDDPNEPSTPADVIFSVPSGTFEGSLAVTMTAVTPGTEIRYTTDGTLPTATSTLYDGAELIFSETTQLRAQLFSAGAANGEANTAIYIRRTFDVTSDIPLVIMENYGAGKPPSEKGPERVIFRDLAFMLFEPAEGEAAISKAPTWAARAGFHVRGQSSASFDKTPYRVELWDEYDEDADFPMIGMTPDSDWAMVGPFIDKSLVRNAFIYSLASEMGLEGPTLRFAEVYLNLDGGPLEAADYQGVYAITESIKNMKGRVNLKQLRPENTAESEISGGYIFKFDGGALREDEGEIEIPCINDFVAVPPAGTGGLDGNAEEDTCFTDLELTDPKDPNAEQLAWIQAYVQELHDALHTEPLGDYQKWLDFPSFVDQVVLNEFTMGGDIYTRSLYMHKDRDGLIKAGPVWDFNFTMGTLTNDPDTWQIESGFKGSNDWYQILFTQPEFRAAAAARWAALRQGILSDEQIAARIDSVSAPLVNAGPRDLVKWPVGEGGFSFGPPDEDEEEPPATWEGQITALKEWTIVRTAWLDAQYAGF